MLMYSAMCDLLSGRRQNQLSSCCVVLLTSLTCVCVVGGGLRGKNPDYLPNVLMVSELGLLQRAAAVRDEVAGDR